MNELAFEVNTLLPLCHFRHHRGGVVVHIGTMMWVLWNHDHDCQLCGCQVEMPEATTRAVIFPLEVECGARVVDEPVDDWRSGFFQVLARHSDSARCCAYKYNN